MQRQNKYLAIVLGGESGVSNGQMPRIYRQLASRQMGSYVVEALLTSGRVSAVRLLAPPSVGASSSTWGARRFDCGESIVETAGKVLELLTNLPQDAPVVIATGDIPLLTGQAVRDFLAQAESLPVDIAYPIVSREVMVESFPHAQRTYAKLKEGSFTGGNLFLVTPYAIAKVLPLLAQVFALRKDILGLARLLGWGTLVRYALGLLSLESARERANSLLGVCAGVVITPHAAIGMDVDKEADWCIAQKVLRQREGGE